jgi:hypothetical protein
MIVEQAVEIPTNRRLYIDVPPEVPAGKAILTFTPASVYKDIESAKAILTYNSIHSEETKNKLNNLRGILGKDAFGGMDGITYQRKAREEWNG